MKVMTLVGTRPELIKMSEIIKKLDKYTKHVFVHTGQNYDYELNEIFYKDLDLRKPDYYLDIAMNQSTLGDTLGRLFEELEKVLVEEKPDAFVVLGDTNSALGAILAKRMKIPVFHLEAGNRCFDDNVPEEINRRILDHISDVNMVYTENSRKYLLSEGIAKDRIFLMGSPMTEVFNQGNFKLSTLEELSLEEEKYFVFSIHRDENTEIPKNLDILVETINLVAETYKLPIILSTHPRLRKKIENLHILFHPLVKVMKPFGFQDYICLQRGAKCVISDSGTISEESSILGFPAITIRNAIERPEAIDSGSILISGVDSENILNCIKMITENYKPGACPLDYKVDNCSERVLRVILGYTGYVNKYVWHKC
jgi:UDP-N-acetylglucosamine 2-epimerase (non-hydrolysing)